MKRVILSSERIQYNSDVLASSKADQAIKEAIEDVFFESYNCSTPQEVALDGSMALESALQQIAVALQEADAEEELAKFGSYVAKLPKLYSSKKPSLRDALDDIYTKGQSLGSASGVDFSEVENFINMLDELANGDKFSEKAVALINKAAIKNKYLSNAATNAYDEYYAQ